MSKRMKMILIIGLDKESSSNLCLDMALADWIFTSMHQSPLGAEFVNKIYKEHVNTLTENDKYGIGLVTSEYTEEELNSEKKLDFKFDHVIKTQ